MGVLRNKFGGPVTLHAVNLPAGVSVADVTVAGGQTSATLTLNTTSSSVAQVSNIQLEGVSGGVNTALNIPLTVQSSVPLPTAPTVLSTTPASSAQDVNSASLTVGVTFSQEMKTDVSKAILFTPSVTNGFCAFQDDGAPQSKVLCTGKFKPNTTYTVTVGTGAKSAAGLPLSQPYSFSFQTAPVIVPPLVDTTAPTLVSHTPSSNAVDVSTTAGVVLNFSEPMNPAETYVSIPPVLHLIKEWSNANTTLTLYVENDINPGKHSNFEWEHLYTVSVTGQDVVGNVLSGVKSFAFTTPKPPDVTRPSISNLLTYPNDGATGLPTSQEVFVQFSEPMNQAVTQVAFNFLTPPIPAANLTFTWNAQGTTLKVKPKTPFAHGQSVVWNVSSGAQDLAGNLLENASAALRGFTVLKGK